MWIWPLHLPKQWHIWTRSAWVGRQQQQAASHKDDWGVWEHFLRFWISIYWKRPLNRILISWLEQIVHLKVSGLCTTVSHCRAPKPCTHHPAVRELTRHRRYFYGPLVESSKSLLFCLVITWWCLEAWECMAFGMHWRESKRRTFVQTKDWDRTWNGKMKPWQVSLSA